MTLRRFPPAWAGIRSALRRREIQTHLALALLAILLAMLSCLDRFGLALVILAIGLVLVAETANTALEDLASIVAEGRRHAGIRRMKDVSAASVLVASLTAFAIGILVFLPPVLRGTAGSCLL